MITSFKSDKSLPELASQINEVIGCSLAPSVGMPATAFTAFPFFGMELSLIISTNNDEEGYEDDGELKFSDYNYEIGLTTYWGQADARSAQLPTLLSIVYLLHQRLGLQGMLVFDVEILLAKYESRPINENWSALYDTVSETTFITFADHLNVLQKRLPEDWRKHYLSA